MNKGDKPTALPVKRDQCKDTGMALVLICLLAAYYGNQQKFLVPAILLLVIDMVWPNFFHYPAKAWFGLAHLMGTLTSKVILSLLFYGLVMPFGAVRRLAGADPMQRKQWKKGRASVFKTRDHLYQAQDIEQPF